MKPTRSFLFVPGNKESWIEKAAAAGADALIFDLEDSVPSTEKQSARMLVAGKIQSLAERGQRVYVRINRSPHLYDFDDLLAVVQPGLEGIALPKPNGPEDVDTASAMIAEAEMRAGVPIGSVKIFPLLETARALQFAYEIAAKPRVPFIVGATAKDADVGRALGYLWTEEGRESLYLKARVVMAARAAGKRPIGGLWQQVHDLDGLRDASTRDRGLGMDGELVLHPSNVPIVNQIYSPSEADIQYYAGMIKALEEAQAAGRASTLYLGEHIDIAHVKTAREIIGLARELGRV
jgi:citrate lyase subunit beta/citryl-CoA lyase